MAWRTALHAGNLLTGLRVVLTPAFVMAIGAAERTVAWGILAAAIFVVVAASDVIDGRVARRLGQASNAGRTFDHFADIGFILSALTTYTVYNLAPWWVPGAIAAAFAFYVLDSWFRPTIGPTGLIGSRIGHVGGVCNYVLIGVLVFNNSAGIHLLPATLLGLLFWLVPLYSSAAVVARLAARRSAPQQAVTSGARSAAS